jgi:hypothetical protein
MMMVREVVSMGGLGDTVEACCKELVKNIASTTRGGPQS